jgi:glycine dehydrogenase
MVLSSDLKSSSTKGEFIPRHVGPNGADVKEMLAYLGVSSLSELIERSVPRSILLNEESFSLSAFPVALSETDALERLRALLSLNQVNRSYIGMGYHNCITPTVIQRNILENPGWYTQYTPYQPEVSQGRLEALLNFQTLISELTGLPVANASLLDEGTACAEAMAVCAVGKMGSLFVVDEGCHPQNIEIVRTRAQAIGIRVKVVDCATYVPESDTCGVLLQYPRTFGDSIEYREKICAFKEKGTKVVVAADPLALLLLESPGALGADIAVGSTQRFGIPLGYGGPHAAFFACVDSLKRIIPGRIVGVSKDVHGNPALRLSLQTREQHIRREKATSNICTAQVLLAVMAGMYAVYHGPEGLRCIASRVHRRASTYASSVKGIGRLLSSTFFDTVTIIVSESEQREIQRRALARHINLRYGLRGEVSVAFDETVTDQDLVDIVDVVTGHMPMSLREGSDSLPEGLQRNHSELLPQKVFSLYHSESEFLRYVKRLEARDLSLVHSMIPLGSCTMKLNATSEMVPVSWPEVNGIHPFVPRDQARGYAALFEELERALCEITGFSAVTLQPNAGSQGEFAGLLIIRAYHESRGDHHRTICLIPKSAHGTNPASAVMAGMKVVVVDCDNEGNIDLEDLKAKIATHREVLAALMVTYPSTHGVFEEGVKDITRLIHEAGGQVYLDGANLNALVGIARPCEFGMDVCHINLHKTFCIPHGGGGPGMGPVGVAAHLAPFLPSHPVVPPSDSPQAVGPISAAPWGSASILPISWMYLAMMGGDGIKFASQVAILNANYMAKRLEGAFPTLYRGAEGFVAHECIIDLRRFKDELGIEVGDVARRLMDYGFHAPTVSWPVAGTLMIEPTESESKRELDRYCEALCAIREEIRAIEERRSDPIDNPIKNAPHTAREVMSDEWTHQYPRTHAAFPALWLREYKFWPSVGRIDAAYGDKNLVCSCEPLESYT